ncbi:MAG: nucleotidyltransferase domain-containing protein [Nanoarchaeota archaeon]|mgnify:CR=1 FL=1
MLKKDHQLLIPFVKEPWKVYTFRNLKQICKKTSESYVYTTLKKYVKEHILVEKKAGNVILYSLNLAETKTQTYVGFISEYLGWKTNYLPFDVIKKVIKKIPIDYFTFIITGSYAKNKQKETSDVDIVIIIDNKQDARHVRAEINYTCEISIPPAHPYVFKQSEFLEMLLNDEANYGKEIVKNNLILYGGSHYYKLIHEAMRHGFDDKNLS